LWVPGVAEKITKGQPFYINDKPAPRLSDLNVCELTPVIEPVDTQKNNQLRYRITPRKGGLGETEVYINGNLTYTLVPTELEKAVVNKQEFYYLNINTDTLQSYLAGAKNSTNPVLVKCKVKGSGIYGRGIAMDVVKETDPESPRFYGVFMGVNDYGNPKKEPSDYRYRDLDYAVKDANDLADAVEASARTLFNPADCHVYRLTGTDENAPKAENLRRTLDRISAEAKAGDVLYIFFAGHGDVLQDKDGKQIRFMLQQADKGNKRIGSFGVDDLGQWCHPSKIKAQKRVFVFDACHSGQIMNELAFAGRGSEEDARIRQLDKLKSKNGMMILAASADNESAYEDETLNQGVLTYHLLQAMKDGHVNDTTPLLIRKWFDETIDLVEEYSRNNGNNQHPASYGDGRFEIGNVDQGVRNVIRITPPRTRIGDCVFVDPDGEAEKKYPQLASAINLHFKTGASRGDLVYSTRTDKSYRVIGTYTAKQNALQVRYKLYYGDTQLGEAIQLPNLKNKTQDQAVKEVVESIEGNIFRMKTEKEEAIKN